MKLIQWLKWLKVLLVKETLAILSDKRTRFILIVPLFAQCILFGYAATFNLRHVPFAIIDNSGGKYAVELVSQMSASHTFEKYKVLPNANQMAEVVGPRKALAVVNIQSNFDSLIQQGAPAEVQIIVDGTNSTTASMAAADLSEIIQNFNERSLGKKNPVTFDVRAWFNPNLETRWNIVTALIGTLSFIQVMILSSLSVAREKENGTFDQLLVTPYRPVEILIAKAVPPILIGVFQTFLVLLIAILWFNIPFRGSFALLYFGVAIFTAATVGIGLTISSIAHTMQQAMFYAFVLLVPMVILSGLVTPVDNMPWILQMSTYVDPLRFALNFVHRVYLEDAPLSLLWSDLIPMTVTAAITLPLAGYFFRKTL